MTLEEEIWNAEVFLGTKIEEATPHNRNRLIKYRELSENFIIKYRTVFSDDDWSDIFRFQKLSLPFLQEYKYLGDISRIKYNKKISVKLVMVFLRDESLLSNRKSLISYFYFMTQDNIFIRGIGRSLGKYKLLGRMEWRKD